MSKPLISCFTNSYGRFGGRAALEHLPKTGIAFLELPIRTEGTPAFFGDEPLITTAAAKSDIQDLKRRIADAGLQVSTCNLTSGNPLEKHVLEITLKKLEMAAEFEVRWVVAGAGEAKSDADRATLFQHLEQIGERAALLGMIYCFETHPGICQHPEGMLKTMSRLNHPALKLNFDTGNLFYYNQDIDLTEAIESVRPHIAHVHLKDTNGNYEDWHFPALGDGGAVDFLQVRQLLDKANYEGPFSLEIEGIEGEPPLSQREFEVRIERSMDHLKDCGFFDYE